MSVSVSVPVSVSVSAVSVSAAVSVSVVVPVSSEPVSGAFSLSGAQARMLRRRSIIPPK